MRVKGRPNKPRECKTDGHSWQVGYGFTGKTTGNYFGGYFYCESCGCWYPIRGGGDK